MYERMLDKQKNPTFDDLVAYSGDSGPLWRELDAWMESIQAQRTIRFPYGNKYGWSAKYALGRKHICDTFAEQGAFAVHGRLSDAEIESVYAALGDYAKQVCDNKYPCGGGGWITFRVLDKQQLGDVRALLRAKLGLAP